MNERRELEQVIAHLENQRASLGDSAVDAAIAELRQKLTAIGISEAKPADENSGERKLVTVMFADLSGFTAMSEEMDPEAVRDLMNRCFDCLVPCIQHYQGTIDKFIGDEIMAVFGIPPGKPVGDIKNVIKDAILDGDIHNDREEAWRLMLETGEKIGLAPLAGFEKPLPMKAPKPDED